MAEYRLSDANAARLDLIVHVKPFQTDTDRLTALVDAVELIIAPIVARHDDLAAAVAALAEEHAAADPATSVRGVETWADRYRAAVSDPAAVLAERDARVKAEAWDEGYEAGSDDVAYECRGALGDPYDGPHSNPYREGQA